MKRRDFIKLASGLVWFGRLRRARSSQAGSRVLAWIGTNRNDPKFQLRAGSGWAASNAYGVAIHCTMTGKLRPMTYSIH